MVGTIGETLDPARMSLDLKARRVGEVVRELVEILAATGEIAGIDELYRQIVERERRTSTGIGDGIAIPHSFSGQVDRTLIAFGRCRAGVRFGAVDNLPVKLFFLMVGPHGSEPEHLRLLSKLSRLLHDSGFRRRLLEAESPQEVMTLFREKEGA